MPQTYYTFKEVKNHPGNFEFLAGSSATPKVVTKKELLVGDGALNHTAQDFILRGMQAHCAAAEKSFVTSSWSEFVKYLTDGTIPEPVQGRP